MSKFKKWILRKVLKGLKISIMIDFEKKNFWINRVDNFKNPHKEIDMDFFGKEFHSKPLYTGTVFGVKIKVYDTTLDAPTVRSNLFINTKHIKFVTDTEKDNNVKDNVFTPDHIDYRIFKGDTEYKIWKE